MGVFREGVRSRNEDGSEKAHKKDEIIKGLGKNEEKGKEVTRKRKASQVKNLNVFYVNSRSLMNKIDIVRGIACTEDLDIIGITETWLDTKEKHFLPEVEIDGYTLFHKDRVDRRGGGVALYVRNTLHSYINNRIKTESNTESLWVDIHIGGNKKIVVGIIYRPPNLSEEVSTSIIQELERAARYNNIYIMGDFNYGGIDWENMTSDRSSEEFLNTVQDSFYKQLVREPTRQGNILDLVLTNNETQVSQVEIGPRFDVSDHHEIRFKIVGERKVDENTTLVPDFRKANYEGLRQHLQRIDWVNIGMDGREEESNEMEILYNSTVREILNVQEKFVPKKNIRSKNNDPKWMNSNIKRDIATKKGLYRKIKRGESQLLVSYNELARKVKKDIRLAKRNYEIKVAREAQKDPKSFYQLYKTKVKDKIGPLKGRDDREIDCAEEISEELNNYFLSIFTEEGQSRDAEPEQSFTGQETDMLKDIVINNEIVIREIDGLKKTKSPGPDNVYPRILKECREQLSEHIAKLFQKSLDTGFVPKLWRQANVVPIFKKGDKSDKSNYRPISLTSVIGKMLEAIIARAVRKHLDDHNLIRHSQHGFSKGKSCLTNLLSFYRKVFETVDKGDSYDIVFLDFSKAFDRVPHRKLLSKIKAHGIGGKVLDWIEGWLSNREQRVQINGKKSEWGKVTSGVPQGSVLGPLLFIIYINDIEVGVSSDVSKFADDTKVGRPVKSIDDVRMLQEDLDKLYNWSDKWEMQFNINKCNIMRVGKGEGTVEYSLNNIALDRIYCARDLGVQVSSDLRPRKQCIIARNKANRTLGFIRRSVTNRSPEVILKLYLSLVRPHLDYAAQFWSPYYRKDVESLEAVQRRMTKMVEGMRNIPYKERLKRLNLHSLERRRVRGDLIEVFKWVKGINEGNIKQVIDFSKQNRTRSNGFKLEKLRFRTNIGKNWFTNRVVNDWNSLSKHVVEAESINSFKRRLDEYMDRDDRWEG